MTKTKTVEECIEWYRATIARLCPANGSHHDRFVYDSGPYPDSAARMLADWGYIREKDVWMVTEWIRQARSRVDKYGDPYKQPK